MTTNAAKSTSVHKKPLPPPAQNGTSNPGPASPTSPKAASHAARIRENQRKSRARKRAYIESLEAQLRRYQAEGVQASVEMQAAGRKVAEENRVLREMLAEVGVGREEVEERLRRVRGGSSMGEVEAKRLCVCVGDDCGPAGGSGRSNSGNTESPEMSVGVLGEGFGTGGMGYVPVVNEEMPNLQPMAFDQTLSVMPPESLAMVPDPLSAAASVDPSGCSGREPSCCLPSINNLMEEEEEVFPLCNQPLAIDLGGHTCDKENSTPCRVAYRMIKAINAKKPNPKDTFEFVIDLWSGFSLSEGDPEGCRVSNKVLLKVMDELLKE